MSTSLEWPDQDFTSGLSKAPRFYYQMRQSDRPEWHAFVTGDIDTPALVETRRNMHTLSKDMFGVSGLSRLVQHKVLEFLRIVTTEATTFPSVVPDDDGVAVLHWVAGGRALQVDVEESGPTYLWAKEPNHENVVLTEPASIIPCAKIKLERIANDVTAVNPSWRERMPRS